MVVDNYDCVIEEDKEEEGLAPQGPREEGGRGTKGRSRRGSKGVMEWWREEW